MLIEQVIKETVDLQGFRVHTVTKKGSGFIAEIRPDARCYIRCGTCDTPSKYRDSRDVLLFRHVPLWNIPVQLQYKPRRVYCSSCKGIRVEKLPWVVGKHRFTIAFADFMVGWARMLPWHTVSKLFRCAWGDSCLCSQSSC